MDPPLLPVDDVGLLVRREQQREVLGQRGWRLGGSREGRGVPGARLVRLEPACGWMERGPSLGLSDPKALKPWMQLGQVVETLTGERETKESDPVMKQRILTHTHAQRILTHTHTHTHVRSQCLPSQGHAKVPEPLPARPSAAYLNLFPLAQALPT